MVPHPEPGKSIPQQGSYISAKEKEKISIIPKRQIFQNTSATSWN